MKLSEYLKKTGMSSEQYFKMQDRRSKGITTLGDYERQERANFISRIEKLNTDYTDLQTSYNSRFFDKEGNFTGSYGKNDNDHVYSNYSQAKTRLDNEISEIQGLLNKYSNKYDSDTVDKMNTMLKNASDGLSQMGQAYEFYSNFHTENDYNAYIMNHTADLENGMSAESIVARTKAYEANNVRMKEIEDILDKVGSSEIVTNDGLKGWLMKFTREYDLNNDGVDQKALIDEYEYLQEQNRLYEKYNKETDSATAQFLNSADFIVNSAYIPKESKNNDSVFYPDEYRTFLEFYNIGTDINSHVELVQNGEETDKYWYVGEQEGWTYATEDEFRMLNYLANTQGDYVAQRYFDTLSRTLSRRRSMAKEKEWDENYQNAKWYEKAGLNALSVLEKLYGTPIDAIEDLGNLISGIEYDPYDASRSLTAHADNTRKNTSSEIDDVTGGGEFLGVSWGDAYQAAMSGIDSVASVATFGRHVSPVIMGVGAASSKAKQLYEQGASNGQIAAASLFSGAVEMIFEKYSIDRFLGNFVNAPAKVWYKLLGQAFLQGGIEASEEMATELSNVFTDVMVLGSRSDWEKLIAQYKEQGYSNADAFISAAYDIGGNVIEAGIMGFISGTGMGAGGSVINAFNTNKAYNEFYTQIGSDITSAENIKSLVAAAKTLDNSKSNAKVKALAAELEGVDVSKLNAKEKTAFEKKAGQLYEAVLEAQNKQGKASFDTAKKNIIREQLNKKGITDEKEIEAATQAIMKVVYNKGALTAKESELLEKVGGNEIASYLINNAAEVTTEGIVTALNNKAVINDTKSLTKKQNTYAREINTDDYIYSGDGKTYIDGENTPVDISGIASIKNGRMTLELSDGRTAELGDVILGSETQAILYEGVLDMGVDAASAQAIVNSYDGNASLSPTAYIYGMRQAVEYGKIGAKAFLDTGAFTADLNPKQREMAYEIGKMTAENVSKRETQRKQRTTEKDGLSHDKVSGGIRFDGITEKDLNETQRTTVSVFKQLFGGYGVTIEFFRSSVNEQGVHVGENGSYDPNTNTIRLDINAGAQGTDTILFTAAHELTHFIKQWSPEKFRVFGEFLLNSYAKRGVSIDDLIKEQQAKAERNGRELDYEAAYEEVVADSCETFLRDSRLFDKLLNLKQQDKSLFEKTKEYISKLFDKVAALRHKYRNFNPDSKEGNLVTQMTDTIEQLHRLWEDAAMTALENSRRATGENGERIAAPAARNDNGAQKNTAENGGEVVRLSQRDNSDNSIKEQLKANLNILNLMETVASVQEFKTFEYKQQTLEWVLKRLENTGYKVNRKGFGEIIIDDKRIKSGLRYSKTNEEKLGFAVLPQVLAKGVEIDTHIKHKNRAYDTVTFAAPVVINGQRGNMAVVVRQEGKNYYKVHRLVMPDGSQFILNKKRDTAERAGGVEINSGLSPTDNVSKNNIPDSTEKVKDNVKKSDRDVRNSVSKMVGENGKAQKNTADGNSVVKFSERDYPIDADVAAIVNNSVSAKKDTSHILSTITAEQNKAINRLNNQSKNDLYRGKYTGGKHRFSDTMIKHALKEHGDFLREGLRAQLPITKKDIARHLSAIKDNKSPSRIKPSTTKEGFPSILTIYEVNGYTLYAEEITKSLGKNLPSDLIGHTMYKAPTLPTAAFGTTSVQTQPKRQSTVLCNYYISSKDNLSTDNFIADSNGSPALLNYIVQNGTAKRNASLSGLIALSSDKANFTDKTNYIEQGYVRCRKPFYITQDNKVFSNSETDVAAKLNELKAQGYDCFVFDYNAGDNYMVAVFNDAQIIKAANGNVIPVSKKTDNTDDKTMRSDRDPAFVSDRELLADALMSVVKSDGEFQILTDYKNNVKQMYMQQQKLDRINNEIKELKQTEPNWYTDSLKKLYEEATKTRNRINNYDKKLLKLEAAAPLREVLKREKRTAEKKQRELDAEKLKNEKANLESKNREKLENYRESLKKSEMRRKIRHVISDLNGYYAHGNKKKNVKIDLQGTVAATLASAEILFSTNITSDDAVRNANLIKNIEGAQNVITRLSDGESELLDEYGRLLEKREQYTDRIDSMLSGKDSAKAIDELWDMVERIDKKITVLKRKLSDWLKRERARLNEEGVDTAIDTLANAYKAIQNSDDDYIKGAYDEFMLTRIESLKKQTNGSTIRDMDLVQLTNLYDVYNMVLTTLRKSNRLFVSGKTEYVDVMAGRVTDELNSMKKRDKESSVVLIEKLKNLTWEELKPIYAFERLGSDTLMSLYLELRKGEDTFGADIAQAKTFVADKREAYGFDKWDTKTTESFKLSSGRKFDLTLPQIMSIYAYSKREQAAKHMSEGGFVFDTKEYFVEKNGVFEKVKNTAEPYKLTDEDLEKITGTLTAEQKKYVDDMQEYLSKVMGAKGNEVSRELYGIDLFKELFYFPLKSSDDYLATLNKVTNAVSLRNSGMTKELNPDANNPIVLSGFDSVWAAHVNKMSLYHSFVIGLENFRRVYNYHTDLNDSGYSSVKTAIKNIYGEGANSYISKFIDDVNGGMPSNEMDNILAKGFTTFKKTAVAASLSTVIQQPTAVVRATAEIDMKYFAGKNVTELSHSETWEEIKKYAPIAVLKEKGGFDAGSGRNTIEYLIGYDGSKLKKAMHEIDDKSMWLTEKADEIGWNAIWNAVKREVRSQNKGLDVKSEEFLKKCGERFTEVVTKTQVYDSVFSRNGFMRSKSEFNKAATSFGAEPATAFNMLFSAALQLKRGRITAKKAARIVGSVVASQVLANALAALIYALRDDDEDESYFEKYSQAFLDDPVKSIGLFVPEMLPYVRDLISVFEGYGVERPDMSVVQDVKDAIYSLGSDTKSAYRKTEDMLGGIANLFGVPLKNVMRTGREIWNLGRNVFDENVTSFDQIGDVVVEGMFGETSAQNVNKALEKGKTDKAKQHIDELIGEKMQKYIDEGEQEPEKKAKSGIRSSVTSYWKPKYEAAVKAKDYDEMNRIRKLLYSTGLYGTLSELDKDLEKWRTTTKSK